MNTSFSQFGLTPTFTNFNANLVPWVCRNKGLWSSSGWSWFRCLVLKSVAV